jgi:peptidyl-prolyl cis-trans isomerase C
MSKSRILILSAACALALAACGPKDAKSGATATAADPAAVTVNGVVIPTSMVDLMVKERTAQGQPDSPELRKAIIDNLTMQTLVAGEAVKKGLDKTPETTRQIEAVKTSILANAFVQDYLKNNPVTDEALKAEYDKIIASQGGKEYKARHILVAKEDEAKDIIAKLKKDVKSFEGMAKAKSMDPGSKANGGDLGWFDPRGMVPEFGAAVAKLEKGAFTQEPVKSQFGYHVILLEDSRAVTPPPLEQVKEQLKQQVQRTNLKKFLDETKAKAKIEVAAAPAASAAATASAPAASAPAPAPAK